MFFFFFSSRRRHTRCSRDWSSDVCSSDLLDEPGAAAGGFDGKAAEEFPSSSDLASLATVDRNESRPLATEPDHGVEAPRHEQLDEGGIGAVLRQAEEVVEVLGARVGAEVGAGNL